MLAQSRNHLSALSGCWPLVALGQVPALGWSLSSAAFLVPSKVEVTSQEKDLHPYLLPARSAQLSAISTFPQLDRRMQMYSFR